MPKAECVDVLRLIYLFINGDVCVYTYIHIHVDTHVCVHIYTSIYR